MEELPTIPRIISGLRRTHGLTWGEIADLAQVTTAELENWINGAPVPANIRETFNRLALVLIRCDHGTSAVNRRVLFQPDEGVRVYDLLRGNKLVEAERRLEGGVALRSSHSRTQLDHESLKARRTPHPVLLLGGDLKDD